MPGKTAQIKVGYDTKIVGPFTKIIEVYSNDPENSRSVITIKGTVDGNVAPEAAARKEVQAVAAPAAELSAKATVAPAAAARKNAKKAAN